MFSGGLINVILAQFTLFLLIGGMAGTTDLNGLVAQLTNLRGIATGFGCQFLLLPLLGYLAVVIFQLDPVYGIMLLLTTTSPGGGFSGFWCSLCNADIALSIAMTTVSTFSSIVMLPANVALYVTVAYGIGNVPLDFAGIAISIAVVISAIATGVLAGTIYPDKRTLFNRIGSVGGMCNIFLALFAAVTGNNSPTAGDGSEPSPEPGTNDNFELPPPTWYVAISSPCILGLIIAFLIARALRCTKPESVAICIECCFQNTGLANSVALTIFTGSEAARAILVPLWYGVTEVVVLSLFGFFAWKIDWTYAPPGMNFFKCILGNHQPEEVELDNDSQPVWIVRLRSRTDEATNSLRSRFRSSMRRLSAAIAPIRSGAAPNAEDAAHAPSAADDPETGGDAAARSKASSPGDETAPAPHEIAEGGGGGGSGTDTAVGGDLAGASTEAPAPAPEVATGDAGSGRRDDADSSPTEPLAEKARGDTPFLQSNGIQVSPAKPLVDSGVEDGRDWDEVDDDAPAAADDSAAHQRTGTETLTPAAGAGAGAGGAIAANNE